MYDRETNWHFHEGKVTDTKALANRLRTERDKLQGQLNYRNDENKVLHAHITQLEAERDALQADADGAWADIDKLRAALNRTALQRAELQAHVDMQAEVIEQVRDLLKKSVVVIVELMEHVPQMADSSRTSLGKLLDESKEAVRSLKVAEAAKNDGCDAEKAETCDRAGGMYCDTCKGGSNYDAFIPSPARQEKQQVQESEIFPGTARDLRQLCTISRSSNDPNELQQAQEKP